MFFCSQYLTTCGLVLFSTFLLFFLQKSSCMSLKCLDHDPCQISCLILITQLSTYKESVSCGHLWVECRIPAVCLCSKVG